MEENIISKTLAELNIKIKPYIDTATVEHQLGIYIGKYIIDRYLPTLSVDILKSNLVIHVTEEETKIHNELQEKWFSNCDNDNTLEWGVYRKYTKYLNDKYYPKELICYVNHINAENLYEVQKGISHELWNSDICNYHLDPKSIDITHEEYHSIIRLEYAND